MMPSNLGEGVSNVIEDAMNLDILSHSLNTYILGQREKYIIREMLFFSIPSDYGHGPSDPDQMDLVSSSIFVVHDSSLLWR